MPTEDMYVVLVRDKGLFVIEPVPGETPGETIELALGLKGGYSSGLVEVNIPDGATHAWVAWVESTTPAGLPHFEFTCLDGELTEAEASERLRGAGQEPLRLERTEIIRAEGTQ